MATLEEANVAFVDEDYPLAVKVRQSVLWKVEGIRKKECDWVNLSALTALYRLS